MREPAEAPPIATPPTAKKNVALGAVRAIKPLFLYSECPECLTRRTTDQEQLLPCGVCGSSEVENVWSDGHRSDALEDALYAEEMRGG